MNSAVAELYARYSHAFDSGEADACAELFTAEAIFTNHGRPVIVGRDALREFFTAACVRSPGTRHFVSNIVIDELAPDSVRGSAYVLVLRSDGDTLRLATMGNYADEFACIDGRWLFSSRYFTPAIPVELSGAPLAGPQQ